MIDVVGDSDGDGSAVDVLTSKNNNKKKVYDKKKKKKKKKECVKTGSSVWKLCGNADRSNREGEQHSSRNGAKRQWAREKVAGG